MLMRAPLCVPLENRTIEKLNEMTSMVTDKSRLSDGDVEYVRGVFLEIVKNGAYYDTDEIESWLKVEGSWKNTDVRNRIVNLSHYVMSRHEQSDKFRIVGDDSCGCGGSC